VHVYWLVGCDGDCMEGRGLWVPRVSPAVWPSERLGGALDGLVHALEAVFGLFVIGFGYPPR
jgi:hypothetical protein